MEKEERGEREEREKKEEKEKDEVARKIQERLLILQQLRAESEAIQRRIIEFDFAQSELDKTIESLEYFDSLDGGTEALMNLGGGVFAYVDVKESKKMLVDVGSGVIIEKEVKDAIKTLRKKKENLQQTISKLEQFLEQIGAQAEKIQKEIAELSKEGK
jgi:prefoldin alpha subunit